jgi:phage shock protein PspC (stress-responsive transcriptional regulator)
MLTLGLFDFIGGLISGIFGIFTGIIGLAIGIVMFLLPFFLANYLVKNNGLHRSSRDSKIFGVAGGLGETFGIDATIIRVIWFLLIFFGGTGFWWYLVFAFMVPNR